MSTIDTVVELLQTVFQSPLQASKDTPLLGAIPEFDSMAVVSIITALEDRFGFVVDDDEINASVFETLGTLVDFVDTKLQA
ncbi:MULTISPECIES: acyl carrier protein [Methylomonas]|uniref:acyl carrier protein n=1 Tax=Methylomonas TaxID=416 RepID=UPI00123214CC|nr:acyl carrier protein [Methylomonas rhizoryzae]